MQRLLLVFLLLWLPVQGTWAAVASICRHESSAQSEHIGHHEHRHAGVDEAAAALDAAASDAAVPDAAGPDAAAPDAASASDATPDTRLQPPEGTHADCAVCHGAAPALMPAIAMQLPSQAPPRDSTPYLRSVTLGVPERLIRPPLPRFA